MEGPEEAAPVLPDRGEAAGIAKGDADGADEPKIDGEAGIAPVPDAGTLDEPNCTPLFDADASVVGVEVVAPDEFPVKLNPENDTPLDPALNAGGVAPPLALNP